MSQKPSSSSADTSDQPIIQGLTVETPSYTFSEERGLLFSTQFSQPAIALMEIAEFEHLKAQGVVQNEAKFAGHSLGEYSALGSCTSFLSLENLLDLIFYRGLRMQNAVQRDENGRTEYSMMAVNPSRVGKCKCRSYYSVKLTVKADKHRSIQPRRPRVRHWSDPLAISAPPGGCQSQRETSAVRLRWQRKSSTPYYD